MSGPDPGDAHQQDSIISISGVQKSYDGIALIGKNLDLRIRRGEFLTILGPSGSGKTTTLMMIAGFEVPTAGEIRLNGRDITRTPPYKRGIGVVFQNYALFPHMNIAENIGYPLKVRGVDSGKIVKMVEDALAMVKLSGFGTRRPAQLSGGQQQRVALARALVFQPELILLDEPLGALDKKLREQMQYELKQIHEELGVTMVYVTHDQSEALIMSDRVAVFDNGIMQQLASPVELYEHPVNAFVADFIGENNRLSGIVKEVNPGRVSVQLPDGELVEALAVNQFSIGDPAILSIRPERVVREPSDDFENIFSAAMKKQIYLGEAIRDVMRFGGSDEFVMKTDNSEESRIAGHATTIKIGWRTSHCLAFERT